MSRALIAVLMAGAVALPAAPASALGSIVYDPTNAIHNAATAAHALESLTNQVKQLEQQALMLAHSPLSQSGEIGQALSSLSSLSRSVTGLTADASRLEAQFKTLFPNDLNSRSKLQLITDSLARLNAAKQTAQDLAKVAADLSGRSADQQRRTSAALTASEGAQGQTAAIQSSTQLMGVLAEQLASLQAVTSAQARLAALEAARAASDREASAEAHRKLWEHDSAKPSAPAFDPFGQSR